MKHCTVCGLQLNDDSKFCPDCGTEQYVTLNANTKTGTAPVVIVLCILTILGSFFGLIRGLFYEVVAGVADNEEYWRGYAFAICNLATLITAIIMLMRKLWAFWLYLVFQTAYIGLVVYTFLIYSNFHQGTSDGAEAFSIFLTALFVIPSAIMLVLYITLVRKHLK
ncbi:MAG: zinc-ribbon domain-containing protein [Bacteroidia bacterium]